MRRFHLATIQIGIAKKRRKELIVTVKFYAYLKEIFQEKEQKVDLKPGASVRDLLDKISDSTEKHDTLFQEQKLAPYVVIIKNGISIQSLGELDAKLSDGDILNIFPFIGGG